MIKKLYRFLHPKFQSLNLEYKVDFRPRYGHGKAPHQGLYEIINARRDSYKRVLQSCLQYTDVFHSIKKAREENDAKQPGWNNGFLPGLDIVAIYTILSQFKPKKYIEVGSGNSTKVAYKAKQDQNPEMNIISVDPYPRAEIDELANQIIREPFENIDFNFVFELEENDVLFIDNSHRILPNSDAMVFFLEVLPRLKPGVIVHIHDIYLPYDYPQFMCDRFYSEQYGLAAFLLANPAKYEPLLPNYFISEDADLRETILDIWKHPNLEGVERHGGSFWLRVK